MAPKPSLNPTHDPTYHPTQNPTLLPTSRQSEPNLFATQSPTTHTTVDTTLSSIQVIKNHAIQDEEPDQISISTLVIIGCSVPMLLCIICIITFMWKRFVADKYKQSQNKIELNYADHDNQMNTTNTPQFALPSSNSINMTPMDDGDNDFNAEGQQLNSTNNVQNALPMNTTANVKKIRKSSNAMSETNSVFYEEPKSQRTAGLHDDEFEVVADDDTELDIRKETEGGLIGDDEFEIVDDANLTKQ